MSLYRAYFVPNGVDPKAGSWSLPSDSDKVREFMNWYNEEKKDLSWTDEIPACPCSILCTKTETCWAGARDPTPIEFERSYICNPNSREWSGPSSAWNVFNQFFWTELWGSYHDGGNYELRSITGKHGNQCVYDSSGDLMSTPPAAGSADKCAPNGPDGDFGGHQENDVEPHTLAAELGQEYIDLYHEVRPVNGGKPCKNYDLDRTR
jgi:hypothetical protein